jgi:hypothetical protein
LTGPLLSPIHYYLCFDTHLLRCLICHSQTGSLGANQSFQSSLLPSRSALHTPACDGVDPPSSPIQAVLALLLAPRRLHTAPAPPSRCSRLLLSIFASTTCFSRAHPRVCATELLIHTHPRRGGGQDGSREQALKG